VPPWRWCDRENKKLQSYKTNEILFNSQGILFENDMMQGLPLQAKVPRYMQKYVDFFADFCLQEYIFQMYTPSLLSATIIQASRKALHIFPYWRPELAALTGVAEDSMTQSMDHVWNHYIKNFPQSYDASRAVTTGPSPTTVADAF